MKRIIWHWSAGAHKASAVDREHYHYIIEGDGAVVRGNFPVSANAGPLSPGKYAAHTLNCNTGSIGIAVAAMAGAVERPFSAGRYPITDAQIGALVALTARLCREHEIDPARDTTLSHAEVQGTLGIAQRGKWDICWLPGHSGVQPAVSIGDGLRAKVRQALATPDPSGEAAPNTTTPAAPSHVGAILAIVVALAAAVLIIGG